MSKSVMIEIKRSQVQIHIIVTSNELPISSEVSL